MSVISSKARTFYAVLPKAACTSVKTMFWELETGRDSTRRGLSDRVRARLGRAVPPFPIHHLDGYVTRPFGEVAAPAGHARICLVRDPLSRLRSAWTNKVGRAVFATRGETRQVSGAGLGLDPTFGYFVENLDAYREISRPAQVHSRDYAWHLGPDLRWYDQVFRIEDMPGFERFLSGRAGTGIRVPRHNEGGAVPRPLAIAEGHRDLLRARLRADYALLGGLYDFDRSFDRLLRASLAEAPAGVSGRAALGGGGLRPEGRAEEPQRDLAFGS